MKSWRILSDQPVLCRCFVVKSQTSAAGPGQQGISEQELEGLIASLAIMELTLSPGDLRGGGTHSGVWRCSKFALDLGRRNGLQLSIHTSDAAPNKQRPQRIPYWDRPKLEAEFQRLLNADVIQPSS